MQRTLILFLWFMFPAISVYAAEVETLFMPGDVIKGHAELEKDCKQCHVRLQDTTQNQLCLDCHDHEDVEDDIKSKKGFHGIDSKASTAECKTCHAEHKGRLATLVRLDKDRFDHKITDFDLRGKHLQIDCNDCHKPDKKYREAPSRCVECHKDDDVHKKQLGDKCNKCHTEVSWADKQFDHDDTGFPLRNSHKKLNCNSCHVANQFKDTPDKCIACHAIKDVHNNRFGNRCENCHRDSEWPKVKFDHDRDTTFRLAGKHSSQDCLACHEDRKPESIKKNKEARDCYSCHKTDDVHQGSNGKKCQLCHNEDGWQESEFDHDNETRFPLEGAHEKVRCQACHIDDSADKQIDRDCYSCHRSDDAHEKQLGEFCDDCHHPTSWRSNVRFDHDLSSFPLIGQHAAVGCESCHQGSKFKDTDTDCYGCHQWKDFHKSALGQKCEDCHNPNGWLIWEFDHSETDFEINGAHVELHCHQCHFDARDKDLPTRMCADCHLVDDIHNAGFSKDCGSCHQEDSFSSIKPAAMSSFGNITPEE